VSTVIHKSSSLSYTIPHQYSPLDESNSIDKQTQKQDAKRNFSYQANEWPFLPFLMSYFSANWRRNKLTVARLFDSGPRSYEKQRENQRCHIETFSFAPLFKNRYDLRIIIAPASSSFSKNPRIKKKRANTHVNTKNHVLILIIRKAFYDGQYRKFSFFSLSLSLLL